LRWLWWTIFFIFLAVVPTPAASPLDRVKTQEISQIVRLKVGRSKVLRTPFALTRISVADPEVADIILISEREIYVNALAPGVTNISMWGKSRFTSASVTVEADLTLLKEKLHQILPKEKIGVEAAGDSIVLSGEVSGPVAQSTALSLARAYVGEKDQAGGKSKETKIVNLMHVGGVQQVMLEVRVAEISRTFLDRMGVNLNVISKQGNFGVQQIGGLAAISGLVRQNVTPLPVPNAQSTGALGTAFIQGLSTNLTGIAGFRAGGLIWNMFFDILKQKNLGRLLAEPNLVTTSGQEASFLAGGEYPIPVPQSGVGGGTTITIDYKKFGVGLNFTPTVLDNDKIAIKVAPEVSQIDPTLSIAYIPGVSTPVPGLRVRRMSTHLEVKDGQTFAMAGLLQDIDANVVNKFPILGEIPILGNLFRSSQWQKQESELVILVTTHLAKPLPPGAAKLPTDKWVDPTDFEKYLLGLDQGRPQTQAPPAQPAQPVQELPQGFGMQKLE